MFGHICVPNNFVGRTRVPPARQMRSGMCTAGGLNVFFCRHTEKTVLQQCIHHNWSCYKCTAAVCSPCFNFLAFQTFKSCRYRFDKMQFPYYMLYMSQLHSYLLIKCGKNHKSPSGLPVIILSCKTRGKHQLHNLVLLCSAWWCFWQPHLSSWQPFWAIGS